MNDEIEDEETDVSASRSSPPVDEAFEDLLDFLKQNRGFDFTGYKRASLNRRMTKRMLTVGCKHFHEYIDYLELHPDEFTDLFNTLLINVTSFFRNPSAWESLQKNLLPLLLEPKGPDEPVRVWTAACASGEETYTVAMVLAEVLGVDQFCRRVKIYATDVDDHALVQARQGIYTSVQLDDVPEAYREKYFESSSGRFAFRADLRRALIFGRHNLVQDASISRLDLLVCRNTLMYFNAELQARILARFHFGLRNPGFLFLGKAEMLLSQSDIFKPVDLKHRLFEKMPKNSMRDRLLLLAQPPRDIPPRLDDLERLLPITFETQPEAQIVIDRKGNLVMANEKGRTQFNISVRDIGRPLQDLEISYRPVELRSLIDQSYNKGQPLTVSQVERHKPDGERQFFEVQVVPFASDGKSLGVSVTFYDITRYQSLHARLEESNGALETASEELHSTNEELETTNEELQSTVEELETTNEELQSANEEMETMNEELQAANSEMEAINNELHQRTLDLNHSQTFLQSILTSLGRGVIVVNHDLEITSWNQHSEDLWGLRAEEVLGKVLTSLDIGLPVKQLEQPVRACLANDSPYQQVKLDAVTRRGKHIACRVTCSQLCDSKRNLQGVILLAEEDIKG